MAFTSVLQMYLDWANSLLCEHGIVINELKEFQDGRIFSLLIHILTGTQLFPSSEDCDDDDEVSSLDRVQTILDYLTGLGIKLKVSASGVLKGELKSILDVIWSIILHFTVHSLDAPMQQKTVRSGKKQLIQWCASQLGETSLDTGKGLAQCFEKNNKLAELIGLFCSYSNNSTETYVNNLTSALIASEEHFGISKSLLSPADVVRGTVEEHALTIYLALLRRKVTQLVTDNDPSEKSSDLNTSAGMPEGLTDEVANSLSQTFSFKFMRSPSVSTAKPRPTSTTHPTPPAHDAVTPKGNNAQPVVRKKTTPLPSKIPVSSSRVNQPSPSITEEVAPILEGSSRKRHQEATDEQKETASSTDRDFKMPSGIPVRKTQKLSSMQPVQTSTPNSKQKQPLEREEQRGDVADGQHDTGDDGTVMQSGGVARQEVEHHGQREIQGVSIDQGRSKEPGARAELDLSDIEQEGEVKKEEQEQGMNVLDGVAMENRTTSKQEQVKVGMQDGENSKMVNRTEKTHIRGELTDKPEDLKQATSKLDNVKASSTIPSHDSHVPKSDIAEESRRRKEQRREDNQEEGISEREKVDVKVSSRICAFVREDGDGERAAEEQATRRRTDDDEKKTKEMESSLEKSFTAEEVAMFRRGEELSLMIPRGLDLSGSRGDELLSMLEAIGTEGKQLRQELNEAKAREDFLTKKLNERFSSQEGEVINRLVGELEMLRRENQRLFQELATARESGAEDRKRCENLQAAVERLEMDVERLTAENFRLKFAADTGYQVTGDDLMAAMSDADTGFQSLPSPGKEVIHPEFQDTVPSPILEAQSDHETRLLAMKTETESMRKLQELLTKAHAENRRLKALQQPPESSTNHEVAMSKVKAELGLAQVEGERLREERAQLKKEVEEGRQGIEEQMQKYKELEVMMVRYSREERESRRYFVSLSETSTQGREQIQINNSNEVQKSSHISVAQSEDSKQNSPTETFSYKPEAVSSFEVKHGQSDIALSEKSVKVTRPVSEGIHRNTFSNSGEDNVQDHMILDSDDDRVKVDIKASVPTDQRVSRAFVVKNDGRGSHQEVSRLRDPLTLPLRPVDTGSDRAMSTDGEDDGQKAQNNPGETPEAVVDWKYLAMSPSPENEMRSIAQYVARPPDFETASEIESETDSRTSDLFMSSNASSPIGRLLSAKDRRPSLGGLIVARSQKFPGADDHENTSVFPEDSQEKDDTLIDESYLTTSQDYVTADENSVRRTTSIKRVHTKYDETDSSRTVLLEEGRTPYYTPMVQRNKLQFSSLSSSLESLRSISRKAREDIVAEVPNVDSLSRNEDTKTELNVPTLEEERKWIQEELGRIRLDNNIPGEKYPDLGRRHSSDKSTMLSSSREDLQFMPPRHVPRWRKFQFRNQQSRTSVVSQYPSSLQSNIHSNGVGFRSNRPTRTVSLSRLNLSGGEGDVSVKTSPTYDVKTSPTYRSKASPVRSFVQRAVSPIRSSSDDMSDEYKPLPNELRKPHVLAERTPVKASKTTVPGQTADVLPGRSLSTTQPGNLRTATQIEPSSASFLGTNVHLPVTNVHKDKTFSDPSILPLLPDEINLHRSKERPGSPTVTDDISASDSVSMVSAPALGFIEKVPSMPQHTNASRHSLRTTPEPHPTQSASIFTSQPISDFPKFDLGREDGSGGISSTLTPGDLDALAEKIILEADSGVSLTSNLDLKNGFPKNMYQHGLLSRDDQTYANSLIAKYIESTGDKY